MEVLGAIGESILRKITHSYNIVHIEKGERKRKRKREGREKERGYRCYALPDGLHHPGVAQLSRAELTIKHKRLLELIWLDAADKERLALTEGGHETVQGLLELNAKGLRLLAGVCGLRENWEKRAR